ncbi:MAG: ribonuclease M5 [Candidatus Izimaplasma sp.]|nr:ribonuclease M5 [Candidatus Izimaplasma bacterium]
MAYNNKIKEVVVVEGYHDLSKLKSIYPKVDCVITNGSEIEHETLEELKQLNQTRGLILFLDPDFQGERIRKIITNYVGKTKHAFLKKEDCINKNRTKVGIEHANNQIIKDALDNVYTVTNKKDMITKETLYELGLVGTKNAKKRRKKICDALNIGLSNAKTLQKKLNMFDIDLNELKHLLEK